MASATPEPIHLDLRRDLPKVRAALGTLRKTRGKCLYSSPCAIGSMLSAKDRDRLREELDDDEPFDTMVKLKVFSSPSNQAPDLLRLQEVFDDDEGDFDNFEGFLALLEAKYLTDQAA